MSAIESIATPVRPTSPTSADRPSRSRAGRQVERDREARLSAREQIAVPRVRLLRGREAGVLADRPRPPAVHVGVGTAGVRIPCPAAPAVVASAAV